MQRLHLMQFDGVPVRVGNKDVHAGMIRVEGKNHLTCPND